MNSSTDRNALLRDLLGVLRDGQLNPEQMARLDQLLASDPEAQQFYAEYIDLCVTLRHYHGVPAGENARAPRTDPPRSRTRRAPRWVGPFLIAATLLLAFGLGLSSGLWLGARRPPGGTDEFDPTGAGGVAVLTRVVDADWEPTAMPTVVGSALPRGRLKLKSGLAQVEFYSGAAVVLEGPAEFELLGSDGGFCRHGKLRARVLPSARGFMISTPTVDLVGPGTEFGVHVEEAGESQVHVFLGKLDVLVRQPGRPAARQELAHGRGLHIGLDGAVRPGRANPEAFVGVAEFERRSSDEVQRRYRAWAEASRKLKDDPRVVLYYSFENQKPWERTLQNEARRDDKGALDGAVVGCQWIRGRWPGKRALEFKRASDRVRVHIPGEFISLSYVAWVRIDGFDRYLSSLLLTDGYAKGAPHWQLSCEGQVIFGVGQHMTHYSPAVLRPAAVGRWVQLATVLDGNAHTLTHYLEGEVIASTPYYVTVPITFGNAEIGNWNPGYVSGHPIRNFNGRMDEFILFNEPLSPEEVRKLYLVGKPTS